MEIWLPLVVAGGATAYLVVGIAKIQLPQPSLVGTWAEPGNKPHPLSCIWVCSTN